jgi:hypothetical protein
MTKYRNDLNQLAKRLVETATGQRLKGVYMPKTQFMRVYLIVTTSGASNDAVRNAINCINISFFKELAKNAWLVVYQFTASDLYVELSETLSSSFDSDKIIVTYVTGNMETNDEEIQAWLLQHNSTLTDWVRVEGLVRNLCEKSVP